MQSRQNSAESEFSLDIFSKLPLRPKLGQTPDNLSASPLFFYSPPPPKKKGGGGGGGGGEPHMFKLEAQLL